MGEAIAPALSLKPFDQGEFDVGSNVKDHLGMGADPKGGVINNYQGDG